MTIQPQPLLILRDFQIAGQTRFKPEGVDTHVVADVNRQITVDGNRRCLRRFWLQVIIEHNHIAGDANRTLWQVVHHNSRPRNVHTPIQREQRRRRVKDHIRRDIRAHHRRNGNPHPAAFRRHPRAPVVNLAPVGVTVQVNLPLLCSHDTGERRTRTAKVHGELARLHLKRHKITVNIQRAKLQLTKQLRALYIAARA